MALSLPPDAPIMATSRNAVKPGEDPLHRFMRTLASFGILTEHDGGRLA